MNNIIRIIALIIILSFCQNYAYPNEKVDSSPNYLILLVHGIGDRGKTCFGWKDEQNIYHDGNYGNLFKYLEQDLGLEGYVYAFDIENPLDSNIKAAKQIGSATEGWTCIKDIQGNITERYDTSWFATAKQKFMTKFYNKYKTIHGYASKADVPNSVIPTKFIVIAHSMGGLAVREYIDSTYYKGEIERLITLDTPHTGADGLEWYNRFKNISGDLIKSTYSHCFDNCLQYLGKVAPSFLTIAFDEMYVSSGHFTTNFLSERFLSLPNEVINSKYPINIVSNNNNIYPSATIEPNFDDLKKNLLDSTSKSFLSQIKSPLNFLNLGGGGIAAWLFLFKGWEGEGLSEMEPKSSYISHLKNAKPTQNGADTIQYRLISATGVPTPDKGLIEKYYNLSPYSIGLILPYLNEYKSLPNEGTKAYAALQSVTVPGLMPLKSGSMLVAKDSSAGEGIKAFENNTKRYEYQFVNNGFNDAANMAKATSNMLKAFILLQMAITGSVTPAPVLTQIYMLPTMGLSLAEMALIAEYELSKIEVAFNISNQGNMNVSPNPNVNVKGVNKYFFAHGYIIEKSYSEGNPSIIEKALEDIVLFGGNASATHEASISSLSASSIHSSTAGFAAPDQTFALLSNKNKDGTDAGNYHAVTIETISENNSSTQAAPIEFNGQKKWVSGVMVKEPPTAIKGVINTFLPKKLKSFEYSENFAAWKPVPPVDEWGNFTVSGLNLAEGQNVMSFRGESWIGNKMNQQLIITVNTIPCLPGNFDPAPSSYTNNPKHKIEVKFYKSKYAGLGKGFNILTCKLNQTDTPYTLTTGEDTYSEWAKIEINPTTALADGQYIVNVSVQSDVGISNALWSFVVDTIGPSVTIETIKPVSVSN